MTLSDTEKIICRRCNTENEVIVYRHVDVSSNPELRKKVLEGSLNMLHCIECRYDEKFDLSFKYIDSVNKFVLIYITDKEYVDKWVKYESAKAYEKEYIESENFLKRPVGISEWEEFKETILVNEKLNTELEKVMLDELSSKDDIEFYEFVSKNSILKKHSDLLFYIDRILVRNETEDKIQQKVREEMGDLFKGDDVEKTLLNLFGKIEEVKKKYLPGDEENSKENEKS